MRHRTALILFASVIGLAACGSTQHLSNTAGTATPPTAGTTNVSTDPTTPDTTPGTTPQLTSPDTTLPPATTPGTDHGDLTDLLATRWMLEGFITVGGLQPPVSGPPTELRFDDEHTIVITGACNTITGTVTFSGDDQMDVTALSSTSRNCTAGLNQTETQVVAQFDQHPLIWAVYDHELTMYPLTVTDTGMHFTNVGSTTTDTAPTEPASTTLEPSPTDRSAILVAAATERLGKDNSFGGTAAFSTLAVVETLGPVGADTVAPTADSALITDDERHAIEAALAPIVVRWVATAAGQLHVPTTPGDPTADAVLSLALPDIDGDHATEVSSLYCGDLCAIGGGHALERQPDGTWIVTGQTGDQWIS